MHAAIVVIAFLSTTLAIVASPSKLFNIECEMCQVAVKTSFPMLGQDTQEIEKDVNKDCKKALHKIPFATTECKHFVDEKLNKIIKELESGTAPADVCKKIQMC